jgi:hypothetical protein
MKPLAIDLFAGCMTPAEQSALDAAVRSILRFHLACWRAMRATAPEAVETELVLVAYLEAGLLRQEFRALLDGNGVPSAISGEAERLVPRHASCAHYWRPCKSREGEGPMEVCTLCSERRPREARDAPVRVREYRALELTKDPARRAQL